ncbi:MAG: HAMP domain-containing protein [Candidatus Hydrogenedentes bacterium]|nr:HAMP domain-containing protein [Candidatus Hydrogenedentota bacterium]
MQLDMIGARIVAENQAAAGSTPAEFSYLRPRRWSFAVYLALTMVGLAAVTLTLLTIVSMGRARHELTGQIGRQLQAQAQSLNNLTAFFLLDKISDLRVLATSDDIIVPAMAKSESYTGTEEAIQAEIDALDRAWVEAPGMTPLIQKTITPDRESNLAAFQLARFLKSFDEHTELLLTDRRGATIAATGRLTDYYQADEDWWKSAWNDGKGHVYMSPPRYDESAGITAMLIAVPVFNGGKEPTGIIRSTLNVTDVLSVISSVKIGTTGYAYLTDDAGDIFGGPGVSSESESGVSDILSTGLSAPSGVNVDSEAIIAHARLARENFDFGALSALDGAVAEAVTGLGLITIVRQERAEALSTVSAIAASGRTALGIAVVASIGIALLAARVVTTPLKRLSAAAEAMGQGHLDTPLPRPYGGEICDLTENFAIMAERLQKLIASVEARSREISETNASLTREVRDRIRAEQELRHYRDQLEERIDERTRELEEAQAELMRQEKLSTLGQLTEKIAQEIRSPLGTVAASLYVLRTSLRGKTDERIEGVLSRADRSIKRCDRIVNELFTFSDRQAPVLQPTPLDSWMGSLLEKFEFPASVRVVALLRSELVILVDRERMRQAVDCVLLNAVQAIEETQTDGGTITVETRRSKARAEISISDTGPGITTEVLSQILEPLFSTKPMGIGLGLPLANAILEEHWGGIEFLSAEGGGARILLWLPVPA